MIGKPIECRSFQPANQRLERLATPIILKKTRSKVEISHTVSVLYSNTTAEDLASSTSFSGKVFQFDIAFNFHTWIKTEFD